MASNICLVFFTVAVIKAILSAGIPSDIDIVTTTEPSWVESCNQTCSPSLNITCPPECFCGLLNNNTCGHCYKLNFPEDYYDDNGTFSPPK
ncbi:hypothetical protein V5799_012508 [Amblyomma americanum]|uniref:Secreted protein n=1 Tax=Amblyomma americanum TaxID=6943 RepID=A0AAQ4EDW1_AMBAM